MDYTIIKFFLNRQTISFFWVPRLFSAVFFALFYSLIHPLNDSSLYTESVFIIPDIDDYSTSLSFNPLFSLSFQLFFNNSLGNLNGAIIGQLISGYACISILNSFKKLKGEKFNVKIPMILMACHPLLLIYSLKFCTENFALLGIAFFFKLRVIDCCSSNLSNNLKIKKNIFYVFFEFIIIFFRSQFIPIFVIELMIQIKMLFNFVINKLRSNYKLLIFTVIFFLFITAIFGLITLVNTEYLNIIVENIWGGIFPFTPKDIYLNLINSQTPFNFLTKSFYVVISYLFYFFISVFFLTGARGRLTDLPWRINIFNIKLESLKNLNIDYDNYFNNFDHTSFYLLVILPLIFFSIFHILGIYNWIKNFSKYGFNICFSPLTICALPLIFFPNMRYFIPLVPLACIGIGIFIEKKSIF